MITKERLEELIEQEATVWCVSELHGSNKLKLHNKDVKDSDCFHISKTLLLSDSIEFYDEKETYRVPFQLLFETKEDAEWHVEFKCIERPERLELPTWEEFISQKFVWFFDKNHRRCCLYYLRCSNQIFIYTFKSFTHTILLYLRVGGLFLLCHTCQN